MQLMARARWPGSPGWAARSGGLGAGTPGSPGGLDWRSGVLALRDGVGHARRGPGALGRAGLRAPDLWGSEAPSRAGLLCALRGRRTGPCALGSALSARTGRDLRELGTVWRGVRSADEPGWRRGVGVSPCAPQSPPRGPRRRTTPSPAPRLLPPGVRRAGPCPPAPWLRPEPLSPCPAPGKRSWRRVPLPCALRPAPCACALSGRAFPRLWGGCLSSLFPGPAFQDSLVSREG